MTKTEIRRSVDLSPPGLVRKRGHGWLRFCQPPFRSDLSTGEPVPGGIAGTDALKSRLPVGLLLEIDVIARQPRQDRMQAE
jgi:hypothetical protein